MTLKFASLGSGSEGNALLISTGTGLPGARGTTVMLDCGFGIRETERRLARLEMQPSDLSGIVVTHEHQDHVGGVFKLARRYAIPVWLSYGTWRAVQDDCTGVTLNFCRDGDLLAIGDLQLSPYTVPHDAREPLQYLASDGQVRLGVLTDAGQSTPHLVQSLSGCDALMLECNHDRQMLADSSYPYSLKQRIGGAYGHLSNHTSAGILAAMDRTRLKMVVGAHLSRQNNTPELARTALCEALQDHGAEVRIACQDDGFSWIDVAA
jgi:phosphoribosyl 1,2-cyclic phosphodiesterase